MKLKLLLMIFLSHNLNAFLSKLPQVTKRALTYSYLKHNNLGIKNNLYGNSTRALPTFHRQEYNRSPVLNTYRSFFADSTRNNNTYTGEVQQSKLFFICEYILIKAGITGDLKGPMRSKLADVIDIGMQDTKELEELGKVFNLLPKKVRYNFYDSLVEVYNDNNSLNPLQKENIYKLLKRDLKCFPSRSFFSNIPDIKFVSQSMNQRIIKNKFKKRLIPRKKRSKRARYYDDYMYRRSYYYSSYDDGDLDYDFGGFDGGDC